jgi:hypothetical protein
MQPARTLTAAGLAAAGAGGLYLGLVTGALPVDTGLGRTTRPLGPLSIEVAAPRGPVFDVIVAPYDMVLAAHFTPIRGRLRATTVETVRFSRPDRVDFRLVRGPVPYLVETFWLRDRHETTLLEYEGELGTDLWQLGTRWGDVVARRWQAVVQESFAAVKAEAERRVAVGTQSRRPR